MKSIKETSKYISLIRANQGHSIPVDMELEKLIPPEILWHGTGAKFVACKRKYDIYVMPE